jgi:RNA polymerase sigma factor (sigma-70 family)
LSGQASLDERAIVARCNRGEEAAWAVLYHTYRDRVYRITHWRRWRFAPEEAEEIMQEVFLALVSSLRAFDFRSSLDTYISQIATNKCISGLRKRTAARAGGRTGHVSLDKVEWALRDGGDPPDERLLEREQRETLQKWFRSLGQACQSILRFRFIDDFSYQEIATLLGVQEGTVASRLSRCLAELREVCECLSGSEGKTFLRLATTP